MEYEAITTELEPSSASKTDASAHIEQTEKASSLSYIPGTMQSMVDDLLAEMMQMDDPFEQMNFIILKLMPAVLAEQEASIEALAPLIESNKEYNERLSSMQAQYAKWGKGAKPESNTFFEENRDLIAKLNADPEYGVQEEMLDAANRIETNANAFTDGTKLSQEQVAWNSYSAPEQAYNSNGQLETYPISSTTKDTYDKALNNTATYQPFLDQTGQELEILKGLNTNVAKQVELDLKYQVEFYNSYVTSIGSMEDNTSKQRRAPIDRLQS